VSRRPAAASSNLGAKAKEFKDELTNLLNNTLTTGIKLAAVIDPLSNQAVIGYGITATDLRPADKIALTINQKAPRLHLDLLYRVVMDDTGTFLTVFSSYVGLYVPVSSDDGLPAYRPLLHYDYEREKTNYTQAHLQIHAHSNDWDRILPPGRVLERLHLPVGGLRYRPTLEDVIEFVADEHLAEMHGGYIDHKHIPAPDDMPKWKKAVDDGRRGFWEIQLRAAIRRNRQLAQDVLNESVPDSS
jgi:hypothetical protein